MTDINELLELLELLDRVENTLQAKGADVEDFEATATLRFEVEAKDARIKELEERNQRLATRLIDHLNIESRLSRYEELEKAARAFVESRATGARLVQSWDDFRTALSALTPEEE